MTFAHQTTPVVGINGNTFVDFTSYSTWNFERVNNEICLCLAVQDTTQMPIVGGQIPQEMRLDEHGDKKFETEFLNNCEDEVVLSSIKGLTVNQRRKYLYYLNKIVTPWSFIFVLKPNQFHSKSQDLFPWESFVDTNLPYTKSMIESLPFSSIGRVVIYGSAPNNAVPCHRDQPPGEQLDHHINVNPGGYRPVYVYDPSNGTKTYLDKEYKLYGYNVRDYHGVDAVGHFSYTLRVDGTYNDEVCDKLNITHSSKNS